MFNNKLTKSQVSDLIAPFKECFPVLYASFLCIRDRHALYESVEYRYLWAENVHEYAVYLYGKDSVIYDLSRLASAFGTSASDITMHLWMLAKSDLSTVSRANGGFVL